MHLVRRQFYRAGNF